MDNQLVQFDIVGLHGVRDYSILFEDNKVIIVGENGSGKTTVFKIMYHTLSCDWDSLRTFDFECVSLHFGNDKVVQISSDLLQSIYAIDGIDRVAYPLISLLSFCRRIVLTASLQACGLYSCTSKSNSTSLGRPSVISALLGRRLIYAYLAACSREEK